MSNSGVEELVQSHLKVNGAGDIGSEGEADHRVPNGEVEESADQKVRDLGDNLSEDEL